MCRGNRQELLSGTRPSVFVSREIDDALVRSFRMYQPVFVELDVLDGIAAVGVGDVDFAVAGLNHAGVGVLTRIRFQMEWGFPGSAFIDRPRHT